MTAKRNRERYAPECGATAGSEPRHGRLALALPVRAPEECRPAPPARHVSTTHLRRFVLLMQYESAVAAEHYTGVRAASIRYAVQRLEERLGTALFNRSPSAMSPTAAADRLYPCAVRLLDMWDTLTGGSAHDAPQSQPSSQAPQGPDAPDACDASLPPGPLWE